MKWHALTWWCDCAVSDVEPRTQSAFLALTGFVAAGDDSRRTAGRSDPWPKAWSWVIGQGRPRPPPYLEVSAVITCTLPYVSARGR
jgi:hypothetical protein